MTDIVQFPIRNYTGTDGIVDAIVDHVRDILVHWRDSDDYDFDIAVSVQGDVITLERQ